MKKSAKYQVHGLEKTANQKKCKVKYVREYPLERMPRPEVRTSHGYKPEQPKLSDRARFIDDNKHRAVQRV